MTPKWIENMTASVVMEAFDECERLMRRDDRDPRNLMRILSEAFAKHYAAHLQTLPTGDVAEEIANLAAYHHSIVQMGDGDNPFPAEMFLADIEPILTSLLERIAELEGLMKECAGYVSYARIIANEKAEKAKRHIPAYMPTYFVEPNQAEASRHGALLARIDAALKKGVDGGIEQSAD